MSSFNTVFIAVFVGVVLLVAAFILNSRRPAVVTDRPAPTFAPLLFADLAVLAALGLWDLRAKSDLERTGEAVAL